MNISCRTVQAAESCQTIKDASIFDIRCSPCSYEYNALSGTFSKPLYLYMTIGQYWSGACGTSPPGLGCHRVVGGLGGRPVTPSEDEGEVFGEMPPEVNEAGTAARTAVRDGVEGSDVVMSVDWVAGAGRLEPTR